MTQTQTDRFFKLSCKQLGLIGYYRNKEDAKIARGMLMESTPELGHVMLLRGPDHWKGETHAEAD